MQLERLRGSVLDYWAIISGIPFSFSCFPVFSVTFEYFATVCHHNGSFMRIFLPALCEIHLITILKNDFNISWVHSKFVMFFDKSMNHNDSYIILFYIDGVNFSLKHCFCSRIFLKQRASLAIYLLRACCLHKWVPSFTVKTKFIVT